jgi:hypothetical protein
MARFPYITGIKDSIVNQLENTSKITIAGEKPFIQLSNFIDGISTISYNSYLTYDLNKAVYGSNTKSQRYPPVITGLSVTAAGSLGSLRKAKVKVKFASTDDLNLYRKHFHVGNTQLVSWGWVDSSITFGGNTEDIAVNIVNNIDGYLEYTSKFGNTIDFLAGILTNFNMVVNSDASVDVEFELSSPSELVAYLEINKQGKTTSVEGKTEEKGIVDVVQALDFDGNLSGFSNKEISDYVINLEEDRNSTWTTFGETDDSYIQLGYALNAIVNKFRESAGNSFGVLLNLDIDESIANCHPNMISVTDNVIFPNKSTMGFKDVVDYEGARVIEVDLTNRQALGPFNTQRDGIGDAFPSQENININGSSFEATKAGYIKHIYVKTEFLKDIAKGVNTIHEYLQKVVSELNIAGAGLYELVIRESFKSKTGQQIYSIVDLTLEPNSKPSIPTLKLFTPNSRLIDLSVNADLPKELATIMMMGDENTNTTSRDRNMAKDMFKTQPDRILQKSVKIRKGTEGGGLQVATTTSTTDPKSSNPNFRQVWEGMKAASPVLNSLSNIGVGTSQLITESKIFLKLPGANRIKLCASNKFGKSDQSFFAVFTDVSCVKTVYFGPGYKRKDALVPITVTMTVLGLSGITIGQSLELNPSPVPWLDSDKGYWQVTNVEHTVDDTRWTTIIELKFRVK